MLPIVIKILLVIHVLVSLLIILLVLMQRPKNEGLGAAFGGGATDQLFGAQTTNVLQMITRWLGGIFFALTLLLSILYVRQGGGHGPVQEKLTAPTVIPQAPPPEVPQSGATPPADGKEPTKPDAATGKSPEATTDPVKSEAPKTDLEKTAEKPAPAENKPAEPAPKPAEPAK